MQFVLFIKGHPGRVRKWMDKTPADETQIRKLHDDHYPEKEPSHQWTGERPNRLAQENMISLIMSLSFIEIFNLSSG